MEINLLKPRKALNKAFLKVKTHRNEIELFKSNLISLLDSINEAESEEFHKNLVSDFLKKTWYGSNHFINTKGRNDLVIHNTSNALGTVGVIIEAKKPTNKAEMVRTDNLNAKAFQELVLYFLRERITAKDLEIKYLVATNIYEWFIFDANLFEKEFAQNKGLVKQFIDFEEGRLSGKTTDFFYKQIAEPAIEAIKHEVSFTHFDIREYDKPLRNADKKDDNILIALYKLLSPEHLLKLPFANDSNSLDKSFYSELLHIIGLTETKEGGKKLIQRKKEGERNAASLIESAIFQLDNLDKISRLPKPAQFGVTPAEILFNVALELSITWINRILFLKLLEAQLIRYHKGDKSFAFLNTSKVQNFDDLNNLFFSVLARKPQDRSAEVSQQFSNVPYLNSSLFEPTEIEHLCLFISQLKDVKLPLLSSTVIKINNQKRTGELLTIEYIFEFLNAYDFAGEGSEEIQEDNKQLINASVLGLIFEKINGYKDGSFFTPGFITMYMCRETIRRAVVQKFNEAGLCLSGFAILTDLTDVYNAIGKDFTKDQANELINSLKICDPAVGSGHFLVSALNEIIAIKSELKILRDRTGKTLRDYHVTVENDELIVTDDDGELFGYNPASKESQRIQETLFHEKQTIIENCLFGVDINPNSVKICRLRLWIELLKNAYYKSPDTDVKTQCLASLRYPELETLPNIDINIKCGNSLISRYPLDSDLKKALRNSKWTIDSYRLAVMTYRNAQSKEEKRSMEQMISNIKNDFESEIAANDKRLVRLNKAKGELFALTTQTTLFDRTKAEKALWDKQVNSLTNTITTLETELEEIRSNKIYENAFEWRFEFPEVLNEEGDFVGFDVVIGNPPYGVNINEILKHLGSPSLNSVDSYQLFYLKSYDLVRPTGFIALIIPNSWMSRKRGVDFRKSILEKEIILSINFVGSVFEDANIDTCIILIKNIKNPHAIANAIQLECPNKILDELNFNKIEVEQWKIIGKISCSMNLAEYKLINKILSSGQKFVDECSIIGGYKPYQVGYGQSIFGDFPQTNEDVINRVYHSKIKVSNDYYPDIKGSNINKYYIKENNQWVKWGEWLMSPKHKNLFINNKIVVREILGKGLIAAFDDKGYFTNDTTHIITHQSKERLLFLLGLLNSRLLGWFFKKYFGEENELFPKIKVNELKSLPFKENPEINVQIINIVNEIQRLKEVDFTFVSDSLESEIDRLVYQLYGLTDEEIRIVEGIV